MYIVYRVTGPHTSEAYYGYAEGSEMSDAKRTFVGGASRADATSVTRGDRRLVDSNNGDITSLRYECLDVFEDEVEAFIMRNDLRVTSVDSITGPTMFPGNIAERALKEKPDSVTSWSAMAKMRSARTAREAYNLGRWKFDAIRELAKKFKPVDVKRDLDNLTPDMFAAKYSV